MYSVTLRVLFLLPKRVARILDANAVTGLRFMIRISFGSRARTRIEGRWGRTASPLAAAILVASLSTPATAQVITYEGNVFPEEVGWLRLTGVAPERRLEDGWFIQTLQESTKESYRYDIGGLTSLIGSFFVEWRAVTDNPEWLIYEWQVPAVVSAAGRAASLYHTVMTESAAVLLRDVVIPRVIVPVSIGTPHVYRVEVFSDEYIWYIDGVVADSGIPEGAYPDPNAFVIWGASLTYDGAPPATTAWDFVRLGRIPDDASGDYDNDGALTLIDQYFVADCLTKDGPGIFGGPGNDAGPGCRFADFDADGDVDLLDFAEFANRFAASNP